MQNNIRTDLAVELNEEISKKAGRLKGIIVNQHKDKDTGIEVTSLKVTNKAGERMIGKPMGTYITIDARKINEMNEDYNNNVTEILKNYISELIGELLKNKKLKIHTVKNDLKIYLTICDDEMSLGLFKNDNSFDQNRILISSAKQARRWAEKLFAQIKEELKVKT